MTIAQSFPPIIGTNPKTLILGSSPGVISLKQQQYFAHPRNTFWPIMAELFDIDTSLGYEHSVEQCQNLPIVIWDSLKQCERKGSLDSAINKDSVVSNDFEGLFKSHPAIKHVFCNGGASFKWFKKLAMPLLPSDITLIQLPSTSPAHAALNFEDKLKKWHEIKSFL